MADERSDLEYGGDGRRLRWLAHNQARRRIIIDAAIRVLERSEPGEDIQVQLIAEEAGLARTVLYRHFHDRVDLDLAVQQQICRDLGKVDSCPTLSFDGTPIVIIRRMVDEVVRLGHRAPDPVLVHRAGAARSRPAPARRGDRGGRRADRAADEHRRAVLRHGAERRRPGRPRPVGVRPDRPGLRQRPAMDLAARDGAEGRRTSSTCWPSRSGCRSTGWRRPAASRCRTCPLAELLRVTEQSEK